MLQHMKLQHNFSPTLKPQIRIDTIYYTPVKCRADSNIISIICSDLQNKTQRNMRPNQKSWIHFILQHTSQHRSAHHLDAYYNGIEWIHCIGRATWTQDPLVVRCPGECVLLRISILAQQDSSELISVTMCRNANVTCVWTEDQTSLLMYYSTLWHTNMRGRWSLKTKNGKDIKYSLILHLLWERIRVIVS
jgi:hypothetical protein